MQLKNRLSRARSRLIGRWFKNISIEMRREFIWHRCMATFRMVHRAAYESNGKGKYDACASLTHFNVHNCSLRERFSHRNDLLHGGSRASLHVNDVIRTIERDIYEKMKRYNIIMRTITRNSEKGELWNLSQKFPVFV